MTDVTDATFQTAVLDRSAEVPVVVDLWAPWCGPCRSLTPILENVVGATGGKVELVKVNVDENPQVSQMFRIQSIPAVYALRDGEVVDGFLGAQGESVVREFIERLVPTATDEQIDSLIAAGDEESLRAALEMEPGHPVGVTKLAELLVGTGATDEALALLARIPESDETRRIAAMARTGAAEHVDIEVKLEDLLDRVKGDDDARQEYVDLLELLGADNPRTAEFRRRLSAALY